MWYESEFIVVTIIVVALLIAMTFWKVMDNRKEISMFNTCTSTLIGDDTLSRDDVVDRCLEKLP